MPNSLFTLWLALFLLLGTTTCAQDPEFVQWNGEAGFLNVPGEQQHITLSFQIREGYHIQANHVADENLIPTVLSFEAPDVLLLGEPVFPEAVKFRMKGHKEALYVYSNMLEIKIPVQVVKPEEKGEFSLSGKLHYQACDTFKCYFPRDLHFTLKIKAR